MVGGATITCINLPPQTFRYQFKKMEDSKKIKTTESSYI